MKEYHLKRSRRNGFLWRAWGLGIFLPCWGENMGTDNGKYSCKGKTPEAKEVGVL